MIIWILHLIVGLIACSYLLLIGFQIVVMNRSFATKSEEDIIVGVSLLIPFKNERDRIETLLQNIRSFKGDQSNFEVIFINDHSDDQTSKFISEQLDINYTIIDSTGIGKKHAINCGVKKAKYDVIATLDADVSVGERWLQQVRQFFTYSKNNFLIMPVLLKNESGLAGFFESLDILSLAGTTIAWAKAGNAILCNGANMAFRKSQFVKHRLKAEDLKLASGDDVFFMHQVKAFDKNSVGIIDDLSVVAFTSAFNDFKKLLNQRSRWTSKSLFYKDRTTQLVSWVVLLNYLSIILIGTLSVIRHSLINLFLIVFLSKIFIDFLYLVLLAIKYGKGKSLWFYPIAVFVQFFFVPLVLIKSRWFGFEWKGRDYKK